jgi:signal peptidase II
LIRRHTAALGIALAVVVADLVTKRYASVHFADSPVEVIPGFLTFTFTENPGAAFSLFQNAGPFLGVAAIVVSAFVVWSIRVERPLLELVALALVLGGAVGNLMDRVFRGDGFLDGKVIDWVAMWWIPTFNIADASVTIAVGLLLIHAWRTR